MRKQYHIFYAKTQIRKQANFLYYVVLLWQVTGYQCALLIEGKLQTTPAHHNGNSTIVCEPKTVSEPKPMHVSYKV